MSGTNAQQRVTKSFAVFDCDAHVNDPDEIWSRYVEPEYRELVRRSYWKDEHQAVLNGRTPVIGGAAYDFPGHNPICLAGPQMTKKIARKLQQIGLTPEQKKYVEHPGAYDPSARLKEMDLMGIDQVMIIPTMMVANFPFVENVDGAYAFARAYNNWARLLRGGARPALPGRLAPAPGPPVHLRGARAHRGDRLPRGAHPPHRRARPLPQLHLPELHWRVADQHHGQGVPEVRGDGDRARHAHLPGPEPRDRRRVPQGHPRRAHDLAGRARRARRRDASGRPHGRRADHELHLRGGRVARAGAALGDARPLSEAPHGDLRVELDLAAPAPRALGPALQALRERAAAQDRPPAERGLLRAVLHRLRVGRDADLPAVGPLRERRRVVLGRLSPRRRRLVERDPRDARRPGARVGAGEAPGRERAAHVRHRGEALRHR